jgi:tetratricopeptide (TPR) repeat protein
LVVRFFERRDWYWAVLLIAFVLIAYAPVFRAGFIWDDESHLTQNPCVVGPLGLKEIWTSARAVYYPLVLTTFWALHKLVGLVPLPYHILTVLMHAGSAVLLWRVLRQLGVRGAWLGAALWALHPVMVQSVAWVTELKNTQSCLFYLLSIFCFLNWEEQSNLPATRRTKRTLMFSLSFVFFLLATLSKPSVVMLPGVLALCIWWRRRRIRWHDTVSLVPFLVVSALASAWTIWEQKFHASAVGPEWAQTWPERLIIAGGAIWFYLGKLFWPDPLIFIYPRWEIHSSHWVAYVPLVGASVGMIFLWFVPGKAGRAVFFAATYYVVSLFPVLGFFSVYFFRYSFVSDHFQYLASMGPLALAGAAITQGCRRLAALRRGPSLLPARQRNAVARTTEWQSFLLAAIGGALLLVLGVLTWRQTAIYHNLFTLYTSTLTKNPGCWMAHYNLGIALSDRGKTDEAIAHYRQAIELRPNYAEAHYNLGRLLAQKGQLDDAVTHYEKALEINPIDAEAHNNLGVTLFGGGRVDEAIVHYQQALTIRPDYADASCNLANALVSKGDLDGAIARYSVCLELSPNQPEAEYDLASALLRKGRTDEAIAHYKKLLELHPNSADAHANLGSAFLAKGRVQEAMAAYRNALRISPENAAAQSNLAWLLATSSDPSLRNGSEAVLLAKRAESESSGSENHSIVLRILAAAYAECGRFTEAKETARQALQEAETRGNSTLANALRDEIALYELALPYHKEQ